MIKFEIDGLTIETDDKTGNILITLKGDGTFYMSADHDSDNNLLVFNASYFEDQWKKSVCESAIPVARLQDRKKDYKYTKMKQLFARGKDRPVHTASLYMRSINNDLIPSLPDGCSRTNFLLANHVKYLVFDYGGDLETPDKNSCFIIDKNTLTIK